MPQAAARGFVLNVGVNLAAGGIYERAGPFEFWHVDEGDDAFLVAESGRQCRDRGAAGRVDGFHTSTR